jgi:glycosyltransferase involved in cell wall biosynthesis
MALISIIVPVYHNARSLPELLQRFQALADRYPADGFEFVFVDDGSKDNSFAVLGDLARGDARVRVVKLVRNFGSNAALLAGLEAARGEVMAAIAADLQDPPELIGDMLAHWRQGHKVVLAERASRDDPWLTRVLANTFYALFRRLALPTMPAHGFDFFVIDRQVRELVLQLSERNTYLMGMLLWLGFAPAVLRYHRRARDARFGVSMWTLSRKLAYFADAFVAFSYAPLRLATLSGLLLAVAGFCYAGVVIVGKLCGWMAPDGWTSLMVVLLLVSGVQLGMLGIVGEYLWRNLEETRRRPRYLVEREVGGEGSGKPGSVTPTAPIRLPGGPDTEAA